MSRTRHDERGTVSAFATVLVVALLAAAGLVVDGGRVIDARITAGDVAAAAARAGAQEVVGVRAGARRIDPGRAERAARAFLARTGHGGTVRATPEQVTVTVRVASRSALLDLVGLSGRTVSATRSARPVSG